MSSSSTYLQHLNVATPCSAEWSKMTGDDRARFCQQCQKHVYNLTVMEPEEVKQLILETEGHFCGRLYERHDGTALAVDCPVGLARWRRAWMRSVAVSATLFMAIGAGVWNLIGFSASSTSSPVTTSTATSPGLLERMREWFETVTGIGGSPGPIMGDICLPAPPIAPPVVPEPPEISINDLPELPS